MADEPITTGDAAVAASTDSSTRRLMREALWLALILAATSALDALGRHDLVRGGCVLSSLLLLVLGLVYWARFRIRLPLSPPQLRGAVFTYVLLGVLVIVTAIVACVPLGWGGRAPSILQTLHLIVLVPLSEELYFRGFLFEHLRRGLGAASAVILCSLLFGLLHMPAGSGLQAGILSVIACLLVIKGGSVLFAVQLHVTWNAVSQMMHTSNTDVRLTCAAYATAFLFTLAVAARMGTSKGDSVTRPA